jgi:hypothetical protein
MEACSSKTRLGDPQMTPIIPAQQSFSDLSIIPVALILAIASLPSSPAS